MTFGRFLLAGIVGGFVWFCWGAISHMALPLGEMGMKNLPAEAVLMPSMKTGIKERGFYMFPGMDEKDTSEAAQKAWEEKYKAGPRGVLIFDPTGGEAMSVGQLATEFISNFLAALWMAVILSGIRGGVPTRAIVAAGLGIFAWLSIDVSYWNWYRFPNMFTLAQLIDQTIGAFLTGLAVAIVIGRGKPAPAVASTH